MKIDGRPHTSCAGRLCFWDSLPHPVASSVPDRYLSRVMAFAPNNLDLKKSESLTVEWEDGSVSVYPIAYLRKMSPSAEARKLREELAKNPLTVLPSTPKRGGASEGPLSATSAELVGNYAIRIRFSDGHDTGIYSWEYLREIDPDREPETPRRP